MNTVSRGILAAAVACAFALPAAAQQGDAGVIDADRIAPLYKPAPYSPYAGRTFPDRPLFGDTHLHTAVSMDAGAAGPGWGRARR